MSSKSLHPLAINTINWVCRQRNVCLYLPRDKRQFFSIWSFAAAPVDTYILGNVAYISPACLQRAYFVFRQDFDAVRANSFVYWVHSAGSFSSCHLTPPFLFPSWPSICPSLLVEPSPFNNLWLHNSHSLLQYKRSRKEKTKTKDTPCPFCLVFTVDCRLNTKASEKP